GRRPFARRARRLEELGAKSFRRRNRLEPLLLEEAAEERLVLALAHLLKQRVVLGEQAAERLLLIGAEAIERALRDEHAAGEIARPQVGDVARLRRPLERQRRRRDGDEAVDPPRVVGLGGGVELR